MKVNPIFQKLPFYLYFLTLVGLRWWRSCLSLMKRKGLPHVRGFSGSKWGWPVVAHARAYMLRLFSWQRTVADLLNDEGSLLTVFGNKVSEMSPFVRATCFHLLYDSMGRESVNLSGQESWTRHVVRHQLPHGPLSRRIYCGSEVALSFGFS